MVTVAPINFTHKRENHKSRKKSEPLDVLEKTIDALDKAISDAGIIGFAEGKLVHAPFSRREAIAIRRIKTLGDHVSMYLEDAGVQS
jgi:hypothetical protein